MTISGLPSDHLIAIRDHMKTFVHGGGSFTGEDMSQFVRRLNTIVSLAENVEEENRLLARQLKIANHNRKPVVISGNVVPFPPAFSSGKGGFPLGGGDAA